MKSNYGAADWSLYAWKRSSSSEREKSSHNLPHEVFILQDTTDLLWNDLAPRSQFWKDSWKTLQWFRSNLCSSDSHKQRDVSSKPFLSWWLKLISWSQTLSVEVRWEGGGGEEALHPTLWCGWVAFILLKKKKLLLILNTFFRFMRDKCCHPSDLT